MTSDSVTPKNPWGSMPPDPPRQLLCRAHQTYTSPPPPPPPPNFAAFKFCPPLASFLNQSLLKSTIEYFVQRLLNVQSSCTFQIRMYKSTIEYFVQRLLNVQSSCTFQIRMYKSTIEYFVQRLLNVQSSCTFQIRMYKYVFYCCL